MKLDSENQSIADLSSLFRSATRRYGRIAIGPVLVVLSLGSLLAYKMPDYYTADFLIYIQPQRVTSNLVKTPDREEMKERLEALVQEILSRSRLRSIIDEFDLYPALSGPVGKEVAVSRFRNSYAITPAKSPTGGVLQQTFRFAYSHSNAQLAYQVAQAISRAFEDESLLRQRGQIRDTEEFLDAELRDAREKLETMEQKVQKFVSKNFDKLPDQLDASVARMETAQSRLSSNTQLISSNIIRIENLEKEYQRYARHGAANWQNNLSLSGNGDPKANLAQLERALVVLLSRYSEKHPDVINTRNRIAVLKSQLGIEDGESVLTGTGKGQKPPLFSGELPVAEDLRLKLNELKAQNAGLESDNRQLKKVIKSLESDLKIMPLKKQELLKIKRDYRIVKANYDSLLAEREKASHRASLVRSQKATQFRIIERAELPVRPTGPNRFLILASSVFSSVVVFLVIPLAVFFLNDSYKFIDEVEDALGIEVIGAVPPMKTPKRVIDDRKAAAMTVVASLSSIAVLGTFVIWFV